MAGVLFNVATKAFGVAGKTALTFSPMIIADDMLNDGKLLKAAAEKGWQGLLHPVDTFNRVSDAYSAKKEAIQEFKTDAAEVVQTGKDVINTGKGVLSGDAAAIERAKTAAIDAAGKARDGIEGTVESIIKGTSAPAGEGEASSGWGKKLGWGAAALGSGWLFKSLFWGGNNKKDEKDKKDNSSFSFGNALMMGLIAIAAVLAFQNRNELTEKFGLSAKSSETAPSTAVALTNPVTFTVDTPSTQIQRSETALGNTFAGAKAPVKLTAPTQMAEAPVEFNGPAATL
jgi:hypothetical protein